MFESNLVLLAKMFTHGHTWVSS